MKLKGSKSWKVDMLSMEEKETSETTHSVPTTMVTSENKFDPSHTWWG
jgi:hypothetical protein